MDIITEKHLLKDVNKDWVVAIAEAYGLDEDKIEFIRKKHPAQIEVKQDEGTAVATITTSALDRDREILVPRGLDKSHYDKNPVVLFGHNHYELPIGKALWLKRSGNSIIAKTKFANTEEGQKVYQYLKDGFPLGTSIGFVPLSWIYKEDFDKIDAEKLGIDKNDLKDAWRVIDKYILLEYSFVSVPANQEALVMSVKEHLIDEKWLTDDEKEVMKEYECEEYEEDPTEEEEVDIKELLMKLISRVDKLENDESKEEKALEVLDALVEEIENDNELDEIEEQIIETPEPKELSVDEVLERVNETFQKHRKENRQEMDDFLKKLKGRLS